MGSGRRGCRRARRVLLAAALSAFIASTPAAGAAGATVRDGGACDAGWPSAVPLRAYDVRLEGIEDPGLRTRLEEASRLLALSDHPPVTVGGIERRLTQDLARFRRVLAAEGFHGAAFASCIGRNGDAATVVVTVSTGPGYRLAAFGVDLVGPNAVTVAEEPLAAIAADRLGRRARNADIVAAEDRVLRHLARTGRPLATAVDREVTVDHRTGEVGVRLLVDPGPHAAFGAVTIEGLTRIDEDYVRAFMSWTPGDPFDAGVLESFRARLLATGLFATVVTEHARAVDEQGRLAITVVVLEAPFRSIGVGGKYSTGDGFAGLVFWEHRNLGGRNEDLNLTLEAGRITQEAKTALRWPDLRRPDEDVLSSLTLRRIDSEAFDELGVEAAVGARLPIAADWRGGADVTLEAARLREQGRTDTSTLIGLPFTAGYDGTDSRSRPTEGGRLSLEASPFAGRLDSAVAFLATTLGGSGYVALDGDRRFVLAARTKVGSIVGESVADLPANKRFYAGGDRSVRGYQFQRVGPLDDEDDPTGGRSLFEIGAELRFVAWRSIELVPFVEGGNVYEQVYPDFSRTPRWAAGIGLRHHILVGPLRLDFAFPLNRRRDVDDPFQFYISLGQAF